MPLVQTRGAASAQGFGEFAVVTVPNYIEEVFSTYLYTGTGANQTIVNGVDLSGSGGLTWIRDRASANHLLMTTDGGPTNRLRSNGQPSYVTSTAGRDFSSFNSNGFSLGIDDQSSINTLAATYVSWSFRKQPKFFDVVTWTGNGTNRTISHNLGSVPGCIIIGATAALGTDWAVYHRSLANTEYLTLNSTAAKATNAGYWNSTTATSSVFSLGTDATVNYNTGTYVAYLFAHDAGGFGLAGTDNVISCGSFTTDGSGNATVSLGYEPQWLMVKASTYAQSWYIEDNMRAFNLTTRAILFPNLANAEATGATAYLAPNSTGFAAVNGQLNASTDYIYIAIRRGPMKVPTLGTSVFEPVAYSGTGTDNRIITSSITPDSVIPAYRNTTGAKYWYDRLRGNGTYLITSGTNAEGNDGAVYGPQFNKVQTGYQQGTSDSGFLNNGSYTYVNWLFKRAPSFFDEVCYTGTGSNTTQTHNLGVVPELMITKSRSGTYDWAVYAAGVGNTSYGLLNDAGQFYVDSSAWNNTSPTSSVFTVGTGTYMNGSGSTYVAYLFATAAGVSKVFSYTGNGSSQTINCGFTGGARFVLIKRTNASGDWYVWDSARGIVAGNDPHLSLNSTAAEVTTDDSVDTDNTGFVVNQLSATNVNVTSATYIGIAIA